MDMMVLEFLFGGCGEVTMAIAPAIIAGIASLAAAGIGAWQNAKARKEEQAYRDKMESRNQALHDRDYYADYTQRAEAQNALREMRKLLQEDAKRQVARQAVMGGVADSTSKQGEQRNFALARFMGDMAGRATALKDRATNRFVGQQQTTDTLNYGALGHRAMNAGNLMYNGLYNLATTDWAGIIGRNNRAWNAPQLSRLKSPNLAKTPMVNIGKVKW